MDEVFALYAQIPVFSVPIVPLRIGSVLVGRSSDCDLAVRHDSVSRRHAEILMFESRVLVRDLDSMNGTFVENARVREAWILGGQQIRFGNVPFLLSNAGPDSRDGDSEVETALSTIAEEILGSDACKLSAKQKAVIQFVLDGLSEKKIAQRLYISRFTVHNHIQAIYRVLNVHSRSELLARFLKSKAGVKAGIFASGV